MRDEQTTTKASIREWKLDTSGYRRCSRLALSRRRAKQTRPERRLSAVATAMACSAFPLRLQARHGTICAVPTNIWFWVAFHVGVFIALAVDLTTFKRRNRELSMRAALLRSCIWIVLSLAFNLLVWKSKGDDAALDFLTGYIIEYSLSVDNIFVFVLIFNYFRVPPRSQHRVLVW